MPLEQEHIWVNNSNCRTAAHTGGQRPAHIQQLCIIIILLINKIDRCKVVTLAGRNIVFEQHKRYQWADRSVLLSELMTCWYNKPKRQMSNDQHWVKQVFYYDSN